MNSGGAPALVDPVLLIFGVPNTTPANLLDGSALSQANIIDDGTGTTTAIPFSFGTASFGLDGNGYQGLMTAGQEVYGFLGLNSANNSNSFTNWSQWDSYINGITADNFGIYVFALDPGNAAVTDFAAHDFIDVTVNGIPEGTFAVAYGMDSRGKDYSTPFTEAGLRDRPPRIPEPMTLALVGIGLVGIGLSRRAEAAPRHSGKGLAATCPVTPHKESARLGGLR